MSLRPRYSLLTLLILTALVAGGVKLWRGPHHVVLHDPPTAAEQEMLTLFPSGLLPAPYSPYAELRYEFVYVQHGGTREYLHARQVPWDNRKSPIVPRKSLAQSNTKSVYELHSIPFHADLPEFSLVHPNEVEHLHHACFLCQWREGNGSPDRGYHPFFYLSTKGTVYTTAHSVSARGHGTLFLALTRVDLTTLPAGERALLEQEIEYALR